MVKCKAMFQGEIMNLNDKFKYSEVIDCLKISEKLLNVASLNGCSLKLPAFMNLFRKPLKCYQNSIWKFDERSSYKIFSRKSRYPLFLIKYI